MRNMKFFRANKLQLGEVSSNSGMKMVLEFIQTKKQRNIHLYVKDDLQKIFHKINVST